MTQADPNEPVAGWKRALAWLERLVLVGLFAFAAYRFGPQLGALTGVGPSLGRSPQFSFVSLEGDTIQSDALRGEVVVLNFWATWCLPCRLEMPSLQSLHEDRGSDGVRVLGLATDIGSEAPIRDFLAERDISYAVGRAIVHASAGVRRHTRHPDHVHHRPGGSDPAQGGRLLRTPCATGGSLPPTGRSSDHTTSIAWFVGGTPPDAARSSATGSPARAALT